MALLDFTAQMQQLHIGLCMSLIFEGHANDCGYLFSCRDTNSSLDSKSSFFSERFIARLAFSNVYRCEKSVMFRTCCSKSYVMLTFSDASKQCTNEASVVCKW